MLGEVDGDRALDRAAEGPACEGERQRVQDKRSRSISGTVLLLRKRERKGEPAEDLTSQVVQSEDGVLIRVFYSLVSTSGAAFFLREERRGELLTAWAWVRMRASIWRSCFLGHHSTAPE